MRYALECLMLKKVREGVGGGEVIEWVNDTLEACTDLYM